MPNSIEKTGNGRIGAQVVRNFIGLSPVVLPVSIGVLVFGVGWRSPAAKKI